MVPVATQAPRPARAAATIRAQAPSDRSHLDGRGAIHMKYVAHTRRMRSLPAAALRPLPRALAVESSEAMTIAYMGSKNPEQHQYARRDSNPRPMASKS